MFPLVQASDLAGFRGAPFSEQVTQAAAESVRADCEWHIAPIVTETVKLRARGTLLLLHSLRVLSIATIYDDQGVLLSDYGWAPNGILERPSGFPNLVTVTYTHGYESCPVELLPVIAERALAQASGRVRSESSGGRSVSLEGGDDTALVGVLSRYRVPGGV